MGIKFCLKELSSLFSLNIGKGLLKISFWVLPRSLKNIKTILSVILPMISKKASLYTFCASSTNYSLKLQIKIESNLKDMLDSFGLLYLRSVIKRPTDSTMSTTSGQADTTSGQTSTTSRQACTTSG